VGSVQRVTNIIAEMAAAGQEQSVGIAQVDKAMTQMNQVTQANAAQTKGLTATAHALATQAEYLQTLVGRFKLSTTSVVEGPTSVLSGEQRPGSSPPITRYAHKVRGARPRVQSELAPQYADKFPSV
jgi:methyl-accepting chemotaxis protein